MMMILIQNSLAQYDLVETANLVTELLLYSCEQIETNEITDEDCSLFDFEDDL